MIKFRKPPKPSMTKRFFSAIQDRIAEKNQNLNEQSMDSIRRGEDPADVWIAHTKCFWYKCSLIKAALTETIDVYKWSNKQILDQEITDFFKFVQFGINLAQLDFNADHSGISAELVIRLLKPGLILTIPDFCRAYRRKDTHQRTSFLAAADVLVAYRSLLPKPRDLVHCFELMFLKAMARNQQNSGLSDGLPNNQDYQKVQQAEQLVANDEFLYITYKRRWITENAPRDWPSSWTLQEFQQASRMWKESAKM